MAKHFSEPLDSRIPEAFVTSKPVIGSLERAGIDAAVVDAAANRAFDQPRALKHLDVLRRCCERHLVRRRKLGDGVLALREPLEHSSPCLIAQRMENDAKPV